MSIKLFSYMFQNHNRAQIAGVLGMFGAILFFVGLSIEYHYGLFPPGSGTLYVLNQVQFTVGMACILIMLWQMCVMQVGGNGRFARITLTIFPIGWGRFALLLQGLYYLLIMMVLPFVLTGSNNPTMLTEILWMATWFLVGLTLIQSVYKGKADDAHARTVV